MGQLIRNNLEIGRVDTKDPFATYWHYSNSAEVTVGGLVKITKNGINPNIGAPNKDDKLFVGIVVGGTAKNKTIKANTLVPVISKGCMAVPFDSETIEENPGVFWDCAKSLWTSKAGENTVALPTAFYYSLPELNSDGSYSIMLCLPLDIRYTQSEPSSGGSGEGGVSIAEVNNAIDTKIEPLKTDIEKNKADILALQNAEKKSSKSLEILHKKLNKE